MAQLKTGGGREEYEESEESGGVRGGSDEEMGEGEEGEGEMPYDEEMVSVPGREFNSLTDYSR